MHLSVMALSAGTPAVILDSHGKVEGLCELASPLAAWVRPGDGLADDLLAGVAAVSAASAQDRSAVPERLRALARTNFTA
jgi:polysaccharide pyruvyl transferase WcaK-like protein